MKNNTNKQFKHQFSKPLVFTILLFFLTLNGNCKDEHSDHDHNNHGKDHVLPAGDAPEGSISELEGSWKTSDGKKFQLKEQKGKLYLLSMFYASCQSVCPRIVADINNIANKIEKDSGVKPNIVMVTFDPKNDTEEALSKYKEKNGLGENWTFLRGTEEDVRMLSVALGVNYKQISNGEFNHSAIISLISKDGFIVARLEGVGVKSDNLVKKFKQLK